MFDDNTQLTETFFTNKLDTVTYHGKYDYYRFKTKNGIVNIGTYQTEIRVVSY